jgi:phosphatidylglycerophosphate synthase
MLKSKANVEAISVKIGIVFSKVGLSPNAWTILALVPAFAGFLLLIYGELIYATALFILSGFIDAVDGAVARVTGAVTNLGAFLDGIIDRYVEILLYLGLLFFLMNNAIQEFFIPHIYWVLLLVFGATMTTFVRAYADHRKVVTEPEDHRRMGGLLERAERLTILFSGMLLGSLNPIFLIYVIASVAVLSNVTAIQRIIFVLRFKGSPIR